MSCIPVSLLPTAASLAAGCLGSLACCAIKSGNTDDYRVSKLMAMLLQIMTVVLILVIQSTDTVSWLSKVPGMKECDQDAACYSLQIAYRLGFTTASVFAFHLVLSLLGRCFANKALNSFWVFKFVFVIAGSAILMLVPNKWFTIWSSIADIGLSWFLVIQMVWIIDFGFSWNDLWVTNAHEDIQARKSGRSWYIGLLAFSLIFLGAAYTGFGLLYRDYKDEHSNKTIMLINVGAVTFLGLVSMFSPRGGILPASLVVLYIAWLTFSTVVSGQTAVTTDLRLFIGLGLACVVMIYASYQAALPQVASNAEDAGPTEPKTSVEDGIVPAQPTGGAIEAVSPVQSAPAQMSMERSSKGDRKKESNKESPEVGSCRFIFFMNSMHLSAACFLMNLCLSWSRSPEGGGDMIAYWVQAVSAWVMLALYGWTLIAPLACPNREF